MIWVLTKNYNDYNQYGEYFVHAWRNKPTMEQLKCHTGGKDSYNKWLLETGGGREDYEDVWYNLEIIYG